MHILYIDGSGSVRNPSEEYSILAGVSVFAHQICHLIHRVDQFVTLPSTMVNAGHSLRGAVSATDANPWSDRPNPPQYPSRMDPHRVHDAGLAWPVFSEQSAGIPESGALPD